MQTLFRRIRGALGMGLAWAIAAGLIGGLFELLDNIGVGWAWIDAVDMWPQTLAIPGFLCGVSFSVLLGIIANNRRIDQLAVPAVAGLGALGGALLAALLFLGGVIGAGASLFQVTAVSVVLTLFSATSATATILIARMSSDRDALPPGE